MARTSRSESAELDAPERGPRSRRVGGAAPLDPADDITRYVGEALAGAATDRPVFGRLERLAYERHLLRDLPRQGTFEFPYVWDVQAALRACRFFGYLRHYKGEWARRPIRLERWQQFVVGSVHGWRHVETGYRRYRKSWAEIPRKNGKSTIGGGMLLLCTFFDDEPGAEGYAYATKKDQAKKIVWADAQQMVKASPPLRKRIRYNSTSIFRTDLAQRAEFLGRDSNTQDGLNPHVAVGDEIHAMRDRNIVDVIETAMGSRRQPLMFNITTAGNDRDTIAWEWHEWSIAVLEGTMADDSWFAFIASIDPDDDPFDEQAWRKANPNLGVSVKIDDMRSLARKAAHSVGARATFLQKRLNVWVSSTQKAIPAEVWSQNAGPVDWRRLRETCRGRRGVPGVDLSTTLDITAEVWVFDDDDGGITLVPFFWCPEDRVVVRTNRDRLHYRQWVEAGALSAIPGGLIKQAYVQASLNEHAEQFSPLHAVDERGVDLGPMVGLDPWNASELKGLLIEDGWAPVTVRQGHQTLGPPSRRLSEMLAVGKVRHGGHPVLSWMAGNLVWRFDANGNFVPDKRKSTEKIDGISATVNGLACLGQASTQDPGGGDAEVRVVEWATGDDADEFGEEFD